MYKMQASNNPYEAPKTSGELNSHAPTKDHWFTDLFAVIVLSCFFANIILLFVGNMLLNLLVDLGNDLYNELPTISMVAYSFVVHWYVTAIVLLGFAIVHIYAWRRLKFGNRRRAFLYSTLVSAIWILFTAVFAFAIISPLSSMATELTK